MEKSALWPGKALRDGLTVSNNQISKAIQQAKLKSVQGTGHISLPGESGSVNIDPMSVYKHMRTYLAKHKASTLFNSVLGSDNTQRNARLATRLLRMAKDKDALSEAFLAPGRKGLRDGWWDMLNMPEFRLNDISAPGLIQLREAYNIAGTNAVADAYRNVQRVFGNKNPITQVSAPLVKGAPISFAQLPGLMGSDKLLYKGMLGAPKVDAMNLRDNLAASIMSGINAPNTNVWTSLIPQVSTGYAMDKGTLLVMPTKYWQVAKALATPHVTETGLVPIQTAIKNRHLPKRTSSLFGSWELGNNPFYEMVLQPEIKDRVFKDALKRGARVFQVNNYNNNMKFPDPAKLAIGDFTGLEGVTLTPLSFAPNARAALSRRTRYTDALQRLSYALEGL